MTGAAPDEDATLPVLTEQQLSRLRSYGTEHEVSVGDMVLRAGDTSQDLVLIDEGVVEIERAATHGAPAEVLFRARAGQFLGEMDLLSGQTVYLDGTVVEPGRIHRIAPPQFRDLMARDPELSDLLLRSLVARRQVLRRNGAARALEIVGSGLSAPSLALRTWAARQHLAYTWLDADSPAGQALLRDADLAGDDLPAVFVPDAVLRSVTPGDLAEHLGLSYQPTPGASVDLVVVGAGPAGLAAAVYGASEGLTTVVLDAVATGGQAAASSRIENYLGFPSGVSGADLTGRAVVQALKFGAQLYSPCQVASLNAIGKRLQIELVDGTSIDAHAVLLATGARYRALQLPRWEEFVGAGIYYAATEIEARACGMGPVSVLGGANSAGQAALYLATRSSSTVTLVIRASDLRAGMSAYLADRVIAHPRITVRTSTEVTALHGEDFLQSITLTERSTGHRGDQDCSGLFCFIGAVPATDWLTGQDRPQGGPALDADGFVLTDVQLDPADLGRDWAALGRGPLPFETSIPGVFAAGDVRHGSMKRVAAAVGEGASVVRSVHTALGADD